MANFELLLGKLREADEGLIALEKAEFQELVGDIKDKVDSIKYVLTKLESESDRLSGLIKEFQAKKKTIDNAADRLKEWSAFSMTRNDTPYLEGKEFTIRLMHSEKLILNENIELDSQAFVKYPGMVKRDYKWDKKAIKDAVKAGKFENLGQIQKTDYVKFNAKGAK